jgi:peptidylprolyl isomerase
MKKLTMEEWVAVVVALVLVIAGYIYLDGFTRQTTENGNDTNQEQMQDIENIDETGLQVETTVEGSGPEAVEGDIVVVNYRGRLAANDEEFDNSYDRGQPFPLQLGQNRVIQGWELGLLGVQAGESRTLYIPAELGYGPNAVGTIPANSDLIFDVEVLEVISAEQVQDQIAQ